MTFPFLSFFKRIGNFFSAKKMLVFWYRHYKMLFYLLFFVVFLIGAWHWYESFYHYRLSDQEKKQYVEQYFKETTFKEVKFHTVVDAFKERARLHQATLEVQRNIFEGEGIQEKATK